MCWMKRFRKRFILFFEVQTAEKAGDFANGRLVRNLFDDLVMNQAKRVVSIVKPDRNDLLKIIAADFPTDKSGRHITASGEAGIKRG